MIADVISNKKLHSVVTEIFIRDKKIHTFWCSFHNHTFLYQKIPDIEELQQIAKNHSFNNIDFDDFKWLYRSFTAGPYSFSAIVTTLPSDNPLHFHKDLLGEV